MKNDADLRAAQIARAVRVPGMGNRLSAGTGGQTGAPARDTTTVQNGQVRRRWLIGDAWTTGYYFQKPERDL